MEVALTLLIEEKELIQMDADDESVNEDVMFDQVPLQARSSIKNTLRNSIKRTQERSFSLHIMPNIL